MSAKDEVLAAYPNAYAVDHGAGLWTIRKATYDKRLYESGGVLSETELGEGNTPSLAWKDAAERLRKEREG